MLLWVEVDPSTHMLLFSEIGIGERIASSFALSVHSLLTGTDHPIILSCSKTTAASCLPCGKKHMCRPAPNWTKHFFRQGRNRLLNVLKASTSIMCLNLITMSWTINRAHAKLLFVDICGPNCTHWLIRRQNSLLSGIPLMDIFLRMKN